jgi:hypothetical protein
MIQVPKTGNGSGAGLLHDDGKGSSLLAGTVPTAREPLCDPGLSGAIEAPAALAGVLLWSCLLW